MKQIISTADAEQKYELLASTMKRYIGERFDKIAGSLTSDDCFEIILSNTKDSRSAERYKEIIASCEAARYTYAEKNLEVSQIEQAIELIKIIEKQSRR